MVKRASLRPTWLSACAGSNPVPRIYILINRCNIYISPLEEKIMDIFLYSKPLLGSQVIGFPDYEMKRRRELPGSSQDRAIFLWLAGDKVTATASVNGISVTSPYISADLHLNEYRLNELPEKWQTPSHRISIHSPSHLRHGLEPVMDVVVRLEDQGIDCLVCNNGSLSSIVPAGISFVSPNIH